MNKRGTALGIRRIEAGLQGEPTRGRSALPRDTALNLVGALVPVAVTFFTVPAYLRAIGEVRYGVLTLVWLIVGYFGLFDLGLGRATTNRLAKIREADPESRAPVFWTAVVANLGLGSVGAFLLWLLIRAWGTHLFGIPSDLASELDGATLTIGLAVPLVTVSSVLIGSLDALQEFGRANAVGVLGATLTAVLPLAAALAIGPTLSTVIGAAVIGRLVAGLVALWTCRRARVFEGIRFGTRRDLGELLGYGSWVSVSSVVGSLLTSLDRFLISNHMGAQAVPFYAVPFSLLSRVQVLAGSLQRALFPRLSADEGASARHVALRSIVGLAAIMTPILVLVSPLAQPFLRFWIGPSFAEQAGPVAAFLVLGIWVNSLAFIPSGLLQAQGRPDWTAKFHMGELIPYLLVLWLGLRYYGLAGAAFAWSARVTADAILLLRASDLLGSAFRELRGPALLILASSVVSLVAPTSLWPRVVVAFGLGVLSGWRSWRRLIDEFPGMVSMGIQLLRRSLVS